jgi:predicted methyltransferase
MIGNFIRYLMLSLVLPLGAFAAASSYAQDYPSLLAAPDRTEADRQNDKKREAEKLLTFIGPRPGWRVLDMAAGAGYSTELMARAVAPGGKVYAQNDKASEKLAARMKTPAMANAVEVVLPFDNLSDPELHDLDLVTFLFGYHDTTFMAPRSAKPCTASPRRRYETRLNARDSRLSQTLISCVIPKTRGPISCSKTRHRTMNSC